MQSWRGIFWPPDNLLQILGSWRIEIEGLHQMLYRIGFNSNSLQESLLTKHSLCGAQLSFLCVAYPSLIITYLGQAAFLMVNPDSYTTTFYASIPSPVYWPMFVVAVLAAIVASQARSYALKIHVLY